MNPLSPFTYCRRQRKSTLALLALMVLMTLGLSVMVRLPDSFVEHMYFSESYMTRVSLVSAIGPALDPGLVSQISSRPDVARVMQELGLFVTWPPISGSSHLFGVPESDVPTLLDVCDLRLKEGRLPRPRSNEIVLSSAIAVNRGLRVGDVVGGETDSDDSLITDDLPVVMTVSGILSPDRPWVGFASYEYFHSHEVVSARTSRLLLVPHAGRKGELDHWLEGSLASNQIGVATYATEEQEYREMTNSISLTFALLECMVAAVAAVALATLNYIFVLQRKEEFGVLNAIGRSRLWLVSRLIRETGSVAGVGWIVGAAICGVGLIGVQMLFYAPRGLNLGFFNVIPWLFTTPLPVSIVLASAVTVARTLSRLDPLSIIERRQSA
jgi:hypothetical protein